MERKHTPVPWYVGEFRCVYGPAGFGQVAGISVNGSSEERDANARLIAAAPELLAALDLLVAGIEGTVSETYIPLVKARAAIAKATGQ